MTHFATAFMFGLLFLCMASAVAQHSLAIPPGAWAVNHEETRKLAEYVAIQRAAALPGVPERGKIVYDNNHCADCHTLDGTGMGIGPDLSKVGRSRSVEYLINSLTRPEDDIPKGYEMLRATFADGRTIEGIRLNEDSVSLQLRDICGTVNVISKSELEHFQELPKRSLMPRYIPQSTDNLDDLVAYLASLRKEEK